MNKKPIVAVHWFRRDLRLGDNAGLFHALISGTPVLPLFIFDRNILDLLEDRHDRRVEFIHDALQEMQAALFSMGSSLEVFYATPAMAFEHLQEKYELRAVYTNHDYEPYARERDELVRRKLEASGIPFHDFKDQVIFDRDDILKEDGSPYTVFTPYSRKWRMALGSDAVKPYPTENYFSNFFRHDSAPVPSLESMGFVRTGKPFPERKPDGDLISRYANERDFPARKGTSRLGVHLRFGTLSIRALVRKAMESSEVFLSELIWREFFQMILWHFPQVGRGKSFRPAYDWIPWLNNGEHFDAWCRGMTGYPLVDAGMRELLASGYMHNRVRMVTASFLAKHLLIDWRWGEAWFAARLLDFDLAANNGGWQWAAGSGCDAAPYFRVFNPALQAEKFDPGSIYIRKWVPEYGTAAYPAPLVDHAFARKRAIQTYARGLKRDHSTTESDGTG